MGRSNAAALQKLNMDWDSAEIEAVITAALTEDVGAGDVSVAAAVSPSASALARVVTNEQVVCTGLPLVEKVLSRLDADVSVETRVAEGGNAACDTVLLTANGSASAILSGQQAVMNLLSRLCGIATLTKEYVREVAGTRAKIRDTRSTTPGLRSLEQYAIRMGGGLHHRAGLFDAIVLYRPHIAAAGGIKAALDQAHSYASRLMNPAELTAYEATGTMPSDAQASSLPIQIEVCDEGEVSEALSAGAESILLSDPTAQEARRLVECARGIRPECVIEICGEISLAEARSYADTGADFLSPSALTTAAPWARLSMLVDGLQGK